MSAAYFNQYLASQVNAASREELLVMLYNGAIRFLSEAESAMANGRVARRGELIGRTIDIVSELSATLDHEIGGELADNLEALYLHVNRELLLANIKDDASKLAQVKQLLMGLRDAWVQALEQLHAEVAVKGVGSGKRFAEVFESPGIQIAGR